MQLDYKSTDVIESASVAIIGDVHECVEELKVLVSVLPKSAHLVFVGDLIDKGGNTRDLLIFMKQLMDTRSVSLVLANHERYVARRILNEISENPAVESFVFTATDLALSDPEIATMILDIYAKMVPFVRISRRTGGFAWVTHAPCLEAHLGGTSPKDIAAQANFRFQARDSVSDMVSELDFLFKEACSSKDLHIFGHVPVLNGPIKVGNKVFLDTGCFAGGSLSAIILDGDSETFVSVPSVHHGDGTFLDIKAYL